MCDTDCFPVDERDAFEFRGLGCSATTRPSVVVRYRLFLLEKIGPLMKGNKALNEVSPDNEKGATYLAPTAAIERVD